MKGPWPEWKTPGRSGLKLALFQGCLIFKMPPYCGSPHSALYPGLCISCSTYVRLTGIAVASGVSPAARVGVGGAVVAVGFAVAVGAEVGVAFSPAHARPTASMATTSIANIGTALDVFRIPMAHLPQEVKED